MNFITQRVITSVMILGSGFLIYFLFKQDVDAVKVSFCFLTLILIGAYFFNKENTRQYLLGFLFFHLLAEFVSLTRIIPDFTLLYTVVSFSYIISYSSLINLLSLDVVFSDLWQKFKGFIIILSVFGVSILYYMHDIMFSEGEFLLYPFIVDTAYNIVVIVLLCFSFLSYVYHDSKKQLVLFLLCLSFSFSEVAQLAYIYLSNSFLLFVLFSVFKLMSFFFCNYYLKIKSDVHYKLLS